MELSLPERSTIYVENAEKSVNKMVKYDNNIAELSLPESSIINVENARKKVRKQCVENRTDVLLPKLPHTKI